MADEKSKVDQFLEDNKTKIGELRAQYGDLIVVESAWGPVCVFRRPGFMDKLKYTAESEHAPNAVAKAWAPVKFVEQLILLPTPAEFVSLRDKYGYDFVDNLNAEVQIACLPEGKTQTKKI